MEIKGIVKVLKKNGKGLQLEDGSWYSNDYGKVLDHISPGDSVQIEYTKNGDFNNFEDGGVKKIEGQAPRANFGSAKDNMIVAQCLTKCVSEILAAAIATGSEVTLLAAEQDVWNTYQNFLKRLG